MPDPSELFTNVYVKGFGVEVCNCSNSLVHLFILFTEECIVYKLSYTGKFSLENVI